MPLQFLRLLCCPLFLALLLPASTLAQEGPDKTPKGPSPEQIEAAVQQLKVGFESKEVSVRLEAAKEARKTSCEEVVKALAKYGLRDKEVNVKHATIDSLGHMRVPASLEVLLDHGGRAKRDLEDDPVTHALLIKSIGRHDAEGSIPYLTKDLFSAKDRRVVQARILSLGRVRSLESVEALISMSRKAGGRRGNSPHGDDLRLALCVLTGVDNGAQSSKWNDWWNDTKKTLEVSKDAAPLPRALAKQWDRYWADPKEKADEGEGEGDRPKDRKRKGKSEKSKGDN
ncbi:MAG TPA: HEAT repeat domain-containing protein [Planctomycetes bacterium]|nr:HEAT repeat domain-containing protein [Planctomycetota bacterium]HIK61691.1 HEAT repeat domain-containing protein [Planctomycetota bacterium]